MREIKLADIRNIQLNLLKKFHNFCEIHQIIYYLSNGTLLGAVKYKGYIPWDDDIDVCMPRPDYNRFIQLWKDNESCVLYSMERNQNYYFPFAKLGDNRTILIEHNVNNGCQLGVNIDIFPLDGFGKNERESFDIYKRMAVYRKKLTLAKLLPKPDDKLFKRLAKQTLSVSQRISGGGYKKYM